MPDLVKTVFYVASLNADAAPSAALCRDARGFGDAIVPMRMNEQSWLGWPTRALLAILAIVVALSGLPAEPAAPAAIAAQGVGGEEVIVILEDGADPVAAAREMGADVTHIYRHVFTGFAGVLPAGAVEAARASRSRQRIFPDGLVQAEAQVVPTGVSRSGVPRNPDGQHLAIPSPIDADIAILDTGVTRQNDLNVVGGKACVKEKKDKKKGKKGKKGKPSKKQKRKQRQNRKQKSWEDDNGHGTHTAGIAAAIDNNIGVVGVAPGARVWAVKVLDARGGGTFGDVICGLDWVVANSGTIDVINLSLSGAGSDGSCASDAFHQAICNVVAAGVPVVVAAGNQGTDAATRVPAAYDQVITVSGLSDSDGEPGGTGPNTCSNRTDDTFLFFSNFGPDVDIMAPGDCILSLSRNGGFRNESGTSEATPHVAGAAADFIAQQIEVTGIRPTPDQTKAWLLTQASRPQAVDGVTGDPDAATSPEPVLWLEVLGGP